MNKVYELMAEQNMYVEDLARILGIDDYSLEFLLEDLNRFEDREELQEEIANYFKVTWEYILEESGYSHE